MDDARRIVRFRGGVSCRRDEGPLGLTLNGVKKHVGILETVDLVVTAKVGRARECRLGPAQLEQASGWIEDYRRTWERRLDRFGAYAEDQQ